MGHITGKSQKVNELPELTENQAREHIERLLWPDGQPVCRHCGSVRAYRMRGATCRPGLCRCRDCGKQFTVTVGTVLEDSHLPLAKWVKAFHLMATSRKGMSALQLQRNLGIGSYRTAWFMAHRIREAMRCDPAAALLKGTVEVDETYDRPAVRPEAAGDPADGRKAEREFQSLTRKWREERPRGADIDDLTDTPDNRSHGDIHCVMRKKKP